MQEKVIEIKESTENKAIYALLRDYKVSQLHNQILKISKTSAQLPPILKRRRIEYINLKIGKVQIEKIEKFLEIKKILKIFDKEEKNPEMNLENLTYD